MQWFDSKLSFNAVLLPFTAARSFSRLIKYFALKSLTGTKQCNIDFKNYKDNIYLEKGHGQN